MATRYMTEVLTPEALAAQAAYYDRQYARPLAAEPDELGPNERAFIEARDSFYLATVTSTGWPYVQHRGGPASSSWATPG